MLHKQSTLKLFNKQIVFFKKYIIVNSNASSMYSLIILPGLLLACICGMFYILKSRRGKHLRHLPTLPFLPFVGNMHYFANGRKGSNLYTCNIVYKLEIRQEKLVDKIWKKCNKKSNPLEMQEPLIKMFTNGFKIFIHMSNVMEKTNLPFLIWFGITPTIVIKDTNDAKMACTEFPEKPFFYDFAKEYAGNGLITAPGHIWKENIKKLAGTFTSKIVRGYQDIFNTQARKLVEELKLKDQCAPFNAMKLLAYTTLESICQAALGKPELSDSIVNEEYYEAFTKASESAAERGLNLLLHPDFIYRRTKAYKQYVEHVAVLNRVSEAVLRNCKGRLSELRSYDDSRSRSKPYIHTLLEVSENWTEEQIKSEVNTIIAAAQETTATTLFFTLLLIGSKKDIQEKLYNEMKEIFGDSKRDVLQEDLERMVYCEGVLNETIRLYPPAPILFRKVEYDFEIESCTLPKGAILALNLWAAGRSRRTWGDDVLEFRPERWSEPTPPFLAFSIGKRACIGKKYAMSFMKTALAHLIRNLVFTSDISKMKFILDITLRLFEGNLMQVQLRDAE